MLMTDDKKDDEATAFYDDRHTPAAAAAEETADRIMVEKFGIAAGRRLRLVVDTPGPERRARTRAKVNSIRKIYYFYNAQISLNKTFLFHSSVVFAILLSIYLN